MTTEAPVIAHELASERQHAIRAGFVTLGLFSVGHFCIDMYSSALGTFQPLLGDKLGLTLTQAGLLGGLSVFSGSVVQPAYGYLSDRFQSRLFSALAPAVAGLFISALGLAPNFATLALLVFLGGAGIASFHPQASARATSGIVSHRGRWMAVFITAGSLGLAFGPMYFSAILTRWGLALAAWAAIPGILISLLLLTRMPPHRHSAAHKPTRHFQWEPLRAVWKPLTILYFLVFIRSIVQIVFTQFLPLYLRRERHFDLWSASYTLSLFLAAGAIGGFAGGHLADRFGNRRIILFSMIGCLPFLALFFFTTGPLSIAGLALAALILLFTVPVNVVMAQDLVPAQVGTVSALMMGFAWGMAGFVFIPLTGWIADHSSLHLALGMLSVFPAVGIALSLKLPK
ncbi:MAG TPA: MFS transporter [Bryobacteraceae bacterium]|nr:MFS transporter [Bryobacteraceae bacterium]